MALQMALLQPSKKMVLCVKSVLSFMVTALYQNILHEEHGLRRGLYLKKIWVKIASTWEIKVS